MPVYHSKFNGADVSGVCGCSLLPVRTARFRGPAPAPAPEAKEDIVDEAIRSFRWNILFKNFEVLGGGDRVLIYLTLWIQKCLATADRSSGAEDAGRQLEAMAGADLPGPGDPGFVIASLIHTGSPQENQVAKAYLKQLRQETLHRLLPLLYGADGQANKWWFQYSKKRFMNIAL